MGFGVSKYFSQFYIEKHLSGFVTNRVMMIATCFKMN